MSTAQSPPASPHGPFEAFGHAIDVEVREGAPDARTVIALHGLTGDRAILVENLDVALARRGLRRVYLDLPGHGRSTGNRECASADHLVAALVGLAATFSGAGPPLVVAHSYGAYLALGLARDLPLGGLFLVCPVVEPELGRRARPPRRVIARDAALRFEDDHERLTFEEAAVVQTAPVLTRYRRDVLPASRAADRAFVEAVRARYVMSRPAWDALARFDRPVEIVCGRHDHWVGFEDAARLARALPDGGVRVVPGCGPLLPLEAPVALDAALHEWLDRAAPPEPQGPR